MWDEASSHEQGEGEAEPAGADGPGDDGGTGEA